jgi:hypothetical protein
LDDWNLGTQPLYYFDAEIVKDFTLDDQLRIRRVKKSEVIDWGVGGPLSFVLDCVSRTSREGEEAMKRLATSLLLFKRDLGIENRLPWFRLERGDDSVWGSDHLPPVRDEELDHKPMSYSGYRLGIGDIDTFRTFWSTCNQTSWHRSLLVAGNRLLQVQARESGTVLEDRLIDLMIACEALVLDREGDKGEKIAHRVGKLQKAKMPHLEEEAAKDLKLAYRLRNDVVHDGEFCSFNLAQAAFPWRFVTYVEQYLRIGMVNYIELMNQGQSKKQIIQHLDGCGFS